MSGPIVFTVKDGTSGAPIEGAAVTAQYSTTCCNCWPSGCSGCNGCTSGSGSTLQGNTDSNGQYSDDVPYTCPMTWDVLVTANGYNDTHVKPATGAITGQVGIPTIQMTPSQNVPQSNQGAAGTAQYAGSSSSTTAGGIGTSAVNTAINPQTEVIAAVALVAIILIAIVILVYG